MTQEEFYAITQAIIKRGDPAYMSHSGAFIEHLENLAKKSDLVGFATSCALYLEIYPAVRKFLEQRVTGILCNKYFIALSASYYNKFIQWTIDTPGWADEIKKSFRIPEKLVAAVESIQEKFLKYLSIPA
ncbi:hypothetical protein HT121_24185 [Pseudomonas sp. MAFF 301514]|uniref:Uncharacterized protein n=1 Tax=Pseudomonas allii TaxID=2740531 RepID=A0A7Y8UTV5_9PSED|nr:hypothetical protein [Pseudomonas allii]NWN50470.1 hypothetical protein [Pseudomonas allii]NWN60834.1 hypothetical protein [Pseudomonas allii]